MNIDSGYCVGAHGGYPRRSWLCITDPGHTIHVHVCGTHARPYRGDGFVFRTINPRCAIPVGMRIDGRGCAALTSTWVTLARDANELRAFIAAHIEQTGHVDDYDARLLIIANRILRITDTAAQSE